jgi:hypothetical protein
MIEIYLKLLGLTLLTEHDPLLSGDVELIAGISPGPFVDVFYPQSALPLPPTIAHYSKRIFLSDVIFNIPKFLKQKKSTSDKFTKVVWKIYALLLYFNFIPHLSKQAAQIPKYINYQQAAQIPKYHK